MAFSIPALWPRWSALTLVGLTVGLPLSSWLASVVDAVRLDPNRCPGIRPREFILFVLGQYALAWILLELVAHFAVGIESAYSEIYYNDHFLVSVSPPPHWEPRRGAMVVIDAGNYMSIDRDFAHEGDEVSMVGGQMFINGWKVPRCIVGIIEGSGWHSGEAALEFLEGHTYPTLHQPQARSLSPVERGHRVIPDRGHHLAVSDFRRDGDWWHALRTRDARGEQLARREVLGPVLFALYGDDAGRFGSTGDTPSLPEDWAHLAEAFERCTKARPPFEETVPPPPRAMDHADLAREEVPGATFYHPPPKGETPYWLR